MRLVLTIAVVGMACVQPFALAQQAGENINVLPVVFPQDDPDHWFLKGDGLLQRQVEPTIAASTRNPDHLVAFFNDYRAVDIADDIGLGETETMAAIFNTTRTIMMAASQLSLPKLPHFEAPPIAAAEAWVGMSRSYDGGLTWSGGFLPGAPFDTSPASLASPVHGLQAATDPVIAPGPCGKFYVVFMAFTRGDESKLVVARYQDLNNNEGGDSIIYQGMTVVETGNNATNGHFLDKPDIEVDIFRDVNPDVCADRVYVSYSTFTGLAKDGSFQSKLHVAMSIDSGLTFEQTKINQPFTQNQGSALAVDPADGTLYAFWRHFFSPDAIVMIKSTNYGRKWSKPVTVSGNIVPMAAFDQPTISTTVAPAQVVQDLNPGFPEIAHRSNGFPTAAVTDNGNIFVAWQERVDIDPNSPDFGRPLIGGSPRIVVVRSTDDGRTWTDIDGLNGYRRAVDMADRDGAAVPEAGFGALPQQRPSGPQIMPKLSFGGGRLMLVYYESRGRIANYGSGTLTEWIETDADVSPYTTFMSGYDRVLDLRAALLDPASGDLLNSGSTTQVSRYPIRAGATLDSQNPFSEEFTDVAAVNSPCTPDSGAGYPPCIRQVNRANAPQSAAGTSPFIGDYVDVAPIAQFIVDGGVWRWATAASDVPYQGFHSIFTDNRHLIPPLGPDEWNGYPLYTTPFDVQCQNAGSRNTDVLTSKVDAGLVLSAPTTFKQLDNQRGFPVSINNRTGQAQSYFVEIVAGAAESSFARGNPLIDSGPMTLFPHSGTAMMVYVEPTATPPIKVQVTQTTNCTNDCPSGTVTLNLDPQNPPVDALNGVADAQYPEITDPFVINPFVINDGTENPFVINPFVINPFVINPFVINPFVINPFVINPFVINPFVINSSIEDVIDITWTVSAGGSNTASSYLPLINIDNAQAFLDAGYAFQLIAYKGSLYGGLNGCGAVNMAQPQILANVVQDPHDPVHNPFVINPFVINPFVINPFVINDGVQNPFVINSTFTVAPSDDANVDGTTKAPPASNEVKVTLRAFKTATGLKNGGIVYDPLTDPPSLVVVPLPCDPFEPVNCNVVSLAPDLVPEGVDQTPLTADAGSTLTRFPTGGWTLRNQGYGDAVAENGDLLHAFYICDIDFVDGFPADDPLDVSDPSTCTPTSDFIHTVSNSVPLDPGYEDIDPIDLTIPSLPEDNYYLVLYADHTLEVSEFNEVNNWVAVDIFIEEPNDPPVATDTTFDTNEDTTLHQFLPASDPNSDTLTFAITSSPAAGTLALDDSTTGAFTYVPEPDFNGTVTFDFQVSDDEFTVGATVTIVVEPVNDSPVAADASYEAFENTPLNGTLAADDIDGDTLSFTIGTSPTSGSAAIDPASGTFSYIPNTGFLGIDSFTFVVSDGSDASDTGLITITVIDPVPNWDFIGFEKPWRPNYKVNAGSAIPLKWYYADPDTGVIAESYHDDLQITATGFQTCDPIGVPIVVLDLPEDTGSSDLRYGGGYWQLNWDTEGLESGCYYLEIYHPFTDQLDAENNNGDSLMIQLK